jgi:hypothetical protein
VKSSITVVGYSHPSFTSLQCVAREEVVTAVCDEHDRAFFGKPPPTKYQQCKAENVTLEAQVVTLEEAVRSLEAEKRSVTEAGCSALLLARSLEAQVATLKEEKRSVEAEKCSVEEVVRSLEGQVAIDLATLTTDLATSRARVTELEQANWTRQTAVRDRRRARRNAEMARDLAEMEEAWDAEQASADAEQVARLARLVAAEREATREADVQTQYFVELWQTHSEEAHRVLDECAGFRL